MSYSRRDNEALQRIVSFLRDHGIPVWVDNEKLTPGTAIWEAEIEKAIKAASAVVVLMSADSKESEWVRREISMADQYHKQIFPVLVNGDEDSAITLRLVTRQYVDLRGNNKAGLNSLQRAISQYLNDRTGYPENSREVLVKSVSGTTKVENNTSGQVLFLFVLGWAFGGLISGFLFDDVAGGAMGGAVGGAIGGLVTSMFLRNGSAPSNQKSMIWITLTWAVAGAIGWFIGWGLLTEAIGAGLGIGIFALIGLAGTLGLDYFVSNWKSAAWIILAWAMGGGIGWSISKGLIEGFSFDIATSWGIGTAIGWFIGGVVMGWQLLNKKS